METRNILIADDHSIVRLGLKFLIKEMLPFAICVEAMDGDEMIKHVKSGPFDLIITDINMPRTDPFNLIGNILAYQQESKILVFSMNPEEIYAKRFLKLGALGYLHKETNNNAEVKAAIDKVRHGKIYLSVFMENLMNQSRHGGSTDNPFDLLSDREIQIAKSMLQGQSNMEIKLNLNIHSSTIGTHKIRLFEKLQVRSMVELAALARLYAF
jgi:DNA-binding NarL/FixJ family response regulator